MAPKARLKSSTKRTIAPVPLTEGAVAHVKRITVDNLPRDANGKPLNRVERDTKAEVNPRQSVLEAFGRVGGVRWLVKYAKRDPKGFAGLLAKAMPSEINVTGTMGYVPMPVPVEVREAIPGEFVVISEVVTPVASDLDPFE